jgi:Concanavalin A-like lectin/glucanases superfamily
MSRLLPLAAFLLAAAATAQNQGLSLQNGTVSYVDVPFSPTLVPSGGITVEAWVTYDSSTIGSGWRYPTVVRMDPSPNQSSYFLRVEAGNTLNNTLLWWVSTQNGNFTISWPFAAGTLLSWTHLAATYDGTTMRLFVNGNQVAQGTASGTILNLGNVLRIGDGDLTVVGGETWNGEIDEVRVWPFARSAAAIQSTMGMSLGLVPGEVSTWNLDGNAMDSSGSNHGAGVGSPTFATNSLVLQPEPFSGAINFGTGTGCHSNGLSAVAALANVGNGGFGLVGTRGPAGQGGFLLLSMASLATPYQILGVSVLVNLSVVGTTSFVQNSALGTCTVGLPIPNNNGFVGLGLDAQFLWLDGACPNGVSASNGVVVAILP